MLISINSIILYKSKTKSNSTVSSLHVNPKDTASNLIDNSKEKANILNTYFASVFTKEPDGDFISLEEKQILRQIPLEFSIDEVRKLLQNLKTGKSPGPDGFHPRFINELADELCLPLYLIFKSSVSCAKILQFIRKVIANWLVIIGRSVLQVLYVEYWRLL